MKPTCEGADFRFFFSGGWVATAFFRFTFSATVLVGRDSANYIEWVRSLRHFSGER